MNPVEHRGVRRRPRRRAGHVGALARVGLREPARGVEEQAREQRMHAGRERVLVVDDRVQVQVRHEARVELVREALHREQVNNYDFEDAFTITAIARTLKVAVTYIFIVFGWEHLPIGKTCQLEDNDQ